MIPQPPSPPVDAGLPALDLLLSREALPILEAGLGESLTDMAATQVRYSPGAYVTTSYSVRDAKGATLTVCAHSGKRLPENTSIVSDGDSNIAVWRFPHDPALPGLVYTSSAKLLAPVMAQVGIKEPIRTIAVRSYRPRRRAVVEVSTAQHRLFLKVVKPSRVSDLQSVHKVAAGFLRVPRSLGWLPDLGIAILEALPGTSLRHRLDSGLHSLPSSQSLTNILDQIPDMPATAPGLVERLNAHRRFLDVIVPAESSRIARIVDEVSTSPAEPIVPAHNDFHAAQVMVSGGAITGLVDIDTLGSGHRADDYAMFLGHLYTSALVSKRGEELAAYGAQLLSGFERQISRTSLRLRTAAAVVGFATAPFRSQQADWPTAISKRLASAEAWLESSAAA